MTDVKADFPQNVRDLLDEITAVCCYDMRDDTFDEGCRLIQSALGAVKAEQARQIEQLRDALKNIAITAQQASQFQPEQFCEMAYDMAITALAVSALQPSTGGRTLAADTSERLLADTSSRASGEVTPQVEDRWHPIETAPSTDKDFFLVTSVLDSRSPFVVRGDIVVTARKTGVPAHLSLHHLTHWQPLPAPPQAKDKA